MRMPTALFWAAGLLVGGAALPLAASTHASIHAKGPSHAYSAAAGSSTAGAPTPATFLGVVERQCRTFTSNVPVILAKDDARLVPCAPTVANFVIMWSALPDAAQHDAWAKLASRLGVQQPTITLAEAEPLIRTTLEAAQ